MDKTNIEYVLPEEIEMRSFEIIEAELAERGITLPAEQDMISCKNRRRRSGHAGFR